MSPRPHLIGRGGQQFWLGEQRPLELSAAFAHLALGPKDSVHR
jgi:hypothetical protein